LNSESLVLFFFFEFEPDPGRNLKCDAGFWVSMVHEDFLLLCLFVSRSLDSAWGFGFWVAFGFFVFGLTAFLDFGN